jgi:hypothetical protein
MDVPWEIRKYPLERVYVPIYIYISILPRRRKSAVSPTLYTVPVYIATVIVGLACNKFTGGGVKLPLKGQSHEIHARHF